MAADSGTYTDDTLARRKKIAEAMLTGDKPIRHWAEGLAEVGKGLIGGYQFSKAEDMERAKEAEGTAQLYAMAGLPAPSGSQRESQGGFQRLASLMSGGGQGAPTAAPAGPSSDQASYPSPPAAGPAPTTFRPGITAPQAPVATAMGGDAGAAIAGIESGGKYDKLGPVTKTGDRAYGKYQVMGANIPQWTKTHLGQEMTPDQFLASPQAQDAVFKGQFGQYANKYGPEGAAKAWFAGERGMNNPNARDQLGTTVSAYADKFNRAYQPGQQPYEVAGPPTAAPQAPIAQAMAAPQMPSAPSGMFANVPKEKLPAILQGLTSKNQTMKALAVQELGNYTKADAPTDEIKEYNLAKRQGFTGSFVDFKTAIKKAGATNVVTNVEKGENAFAKTAGETQAKRFDELAEGGQQAKQMISDIDTLTELGKNIGTGKGAEFKAKVGPYAEALGVPIKNLPDIQAYEAIVNRVAPSLRVKGSGAQSDLELKNFLKSLPSLGNTPEGNALAGATIKGLQENKVRAAEIASKALNGEITRPEADKQLRELPDPMTNYREFMKARKNTSSAAKATEIDPAALEEAKRRGLIK